MPGLLKSTEREPYDVQAYSNRLMKYFTDNNKNIISFSEFCEGKEHWETCRYFFACLHLAASDHVGISTIKKPDGTDVLYLTLISKD
ncbi:hypothetical protein JTE90_027545 [Oedothorax gibbosus]|uniref:Condensin-2 complex subunit H2 C-terminal domain-containing protein n=1 Tax=Oedothorax gibbosus TaxID=931172 RepID=A0AAV6VMB2_9ARAC|nr:hypothetical protein JTE90_027545 [Oedothorax gibbosus]